MSMFSFPADMKMNEMMKPMSTMANWTNTEEMAVSPLMVYPLGAAAAATAIGFGMAGQMTGMMLGAMQAAMQSQSSALGARPDLSWMLPVFAEDLAPQEADSEEAGAGAAAMPASDSRSANIVELKPAAKAAAAALGEQPEKTKPTAGKKTQGKATQARASATKSDNNGAGTVATMEKLKSDADVAAAAAQETATTGKAVARLEPEDFRRPLEIERPENPDDLKLISGVGPKLEQVLNGLGVWSFAQIADWKAEETAWVDDYLQFKGRIDRDDWISQARALAEGGKTA